MTRDEVNDLMIGMAVVALGYALYRHFKPAAKAKAPAAKAKAPAPAQVGSYPYNGMSPYTSMQDLLSGAVSDFGAYDGQNHLALLEAAPVEWWKSAPPKMGAVR